MTRAAFIDLIRREGLERWPDLDAQHATGIADAERVLAGLRGSVVIDHPCVQGLRMDLDGSVGAKIFCLLCAGAYEAGDFDLYQSHLAPGERVLELGGGIGITAARCAQITGREVVVVEPNPHLHDLIRRQANLNGVSVRIDPRCATGTTAAEHIPFFLHGEMWRSSMLAEPGESYQQIQVATVAINSLLDAIRPDVLIVDIEGAECDLFHETPKHFPAKLFIEVHVPRIGEVASADLVERLTRHGYALTDHRDWMFFFETAAERA